MNHFVIKVSLLKDSIGIQLNVC